MPDSPCCHVELAFGLHGGLCPKCLNIYTPLAVSKMPGFDPDFVHSAALVFATLYGNGALKEGINEVDFAEDGIIIQHKGFTE